MSIPPTMPEWANTPKPTTRANGHAVSFERPQSLAELEEILSYIPDGGYDHWYTVLAAIHDATGGSSAGFMLADRWSSRGCKYQGPHDVETHWKSFTPGKGVTKATLAKFAGEHGADLAEIARRHRGGVAVVRSSSRITTDDDEPLPLTRTLPPADPFPLDALGPLKNAAIAIQLATQAPAAICANSVIATAALAAQAHADIVLPTGKVKPLSLFILTIALSGERKSSVDSYAVQSVKKRQSELREVVESEIATYVAEKKAWEAQSKKIENNKTLDYRQQAEKLLALGPAPQPPLQPLLLMHEPTIEGLTKLLIDGQPSVGIFTSEGGAFIGGHGFSDDTKLRTAATLSLLWDDGGISRVRAGDGAQSAEGKRVSVHLQAQPDVGAQFFNDRVLLDQGLVGRFLVAAPDSTQGQRVWKEMGGAHNSALDDLNDRIGKLLAKKALLRPGSRNELQPRQVHLSAEARSLWISFANAIELRVAPDGDLKVIASFANKLCEHAARLAGVLTIYHDETAAEISREAMQRGFDLAFYYAQTAVRMSNAALVNSELREAEQISQWLREKWRSSEGKFISVTDLVQHGPNAIRDTSKARQTIATLEQHRHLIRVEGSQKIKGKTRRQVWEIRS